MKFPKHRGPFDPRAPHEIPANEGELFKACTAIREHSDAISVMALSFQAGMLPADCSKEEVMSLIESEIVNLTEVMQYVCKYQVN